MSLVKMYKQTRGLAGASATTTNGWLLLHHKTLQLMHTMRTRAITRAIKIRTLLKEVGVVDIVGCIYSTKDAEVQPHSLPPLQTPTTMLLLATTIRYSSTYHNNTHP